MSIGMNDFGGGNGPQELGVATGSPTDQPTASQNPLVRAARGRRGRWTGMLLSGALMLFAYRLMGMRSARRTGWLARWMRPAARRRTWSASASRY